MTAIEAERQVTDPEAVRLMWLPRKRLHLRPFLGRSASLSEAAALLGLKKPAMSYWIRKLLDLGLIVELPRPAGTRRAVPRYRCVADRLRVSLADAPLESHVAVFDEMDALWQPRLRPALARCLMRQAKHLDLTVQASEAQGLITALAPRGSQPPADDYVYASGRLWLSAAERDRLRLELDALWERYAALSDRASKSAVALVHLVAVPDVAR